MKQGIYLMLLIFFVLTAQSDFDRVVITPAIKKIIEKNRLTLAEYCDLFYWFPCSTATGATDCQLGPKKLIDALQKSGHLIPQFLDSIIKIEQHLAKNKLAIINIDGTSSQELKHYLEEFKESVKLLNVNRNEGNMAVLEGQDKKLEVQKQQKNKHARQDIHIEQHNDSIVSQFWKIFDAVNNQFSDLSLKVKNVILQNKLSFFLSSTAVLYVCAVAYLKFLEYQLRDKNCWSLWNNKKIDEWQYDSVIKDVLIEIVKRYSTDYKLINKTTMFRKFLQNIEIETSRLKNYKNISKIAESMHVNSLITIIPLNKTLIANANERLVQLELLKNAFLTWYALQVPDLE